MSHEPMNPNELGDWLDALLRGEDVPPTDPALMEIAERLAQAPRPSAPPALMERISAELRPSAPSADLGQTARWGRFLGGALGIVAVVGVAALIWGGMPRGMSPAQGAPTEEIPLLSSATTTATSTPSATATATSTATSTPSATATATSTATSTPSATATATSTPSATATATSTATSTPSDEPSLSASPTMTALAGFVNASGLVNVRVGPGLDHDIITRLQPGTPIIVISIDEGGEWGQIHLGEDLSGWVAIALIGWGKTEAGGASPGASVGGGSSAASGGDTGTGGNPARGGDFGCAHPGNYCNAPGQGNENNGNRGKGN